jgi:non-specific serine/threonine protein kinase
LVSLVGAGGVGKSRLAIEEAARLAPRFADGVDLADLSGVADPAFVWSTVARTVSVEERTDADLAGRLAQVLRPQVRLLVLDNCEHLRTASAEVATQLLSTCPGLSILATSREGLGVPGEVIWRVPSLAFPWPEHPPILDELGRFGALALFAERARAARPDLMIAEADIAALSLICFRLDGIPLALELAAARVSAMSIQEIAARLDDRFTLLSRAAVGPARHQTLRASVDWSHQLLSQPERALFRRLAVFAGSWSLDEAEAVCARPPVPPGEVAWLLAMLVDKSLVQAEDSATGTRYRLLQAIRSFAHEQLAVSGELDDIATEHGMYFAELGEQAAVRFHGQDQDWWAKRLDQDQANLRAARVWCGADSARTALGLRMASGLGQYWLLRGLLEEGADWLRQALHRAPGPAGPRAAALTWLAVITSLRGEFKQGGELFAAAIDDYERASDPQGQAQALAILGFWRANECDHHGATAALNRAHALAGLSQDRYATAFVLLMSALAAFLMADTRGAKTYAVQSAELSGEIGDRRGVGYARCVLADCLINEGAPAQGLTALRECFGEFEALTDRWGVLISTGSAAQAYAALGDWAQAAFALGVADSLSERIGGRPFPGVQAAVDAVAAKTEAELGAAAMRRREAGRKAGRGDQVAAALGLTAKVPGPCLPQDLPLTRRENEITQLIAEGLTNRQISARLFIAQRTVDTHVGRILTKLGCNNRSQVAALTGPAGLRPQSPSRPSGVPGRLRMPCT